MASSGKEPSGGTGLLSGTRTRSYGSVVKSVHLPVREKRIEHEVKPGETLQGLALKYGVTMEQIKRMNRLYTSDSIFLKKTLYIPVPSDREASYNGQEAEFLEQKGKAGEGTIQADESEKKPTAKETCDTSLPSDSLSAEAYLKKLDSDIKRCTEVAVKKIHEGSIQIMDNQSGPYSTSSYHISSMDRPADNAQTPSPRTQQRSLLGPVPLTRTTRAATLRDHEDEIFKL